MQTGITRRDIDDPIDGRVWAEYKERALNKWNNGQTDGQ